MEFHHKPKPWHGWREFLREYVVVVVGVLTAAAVGLTVDWLHRMAEVRETREALSDEIGSNLRNTAFSQVEDRCLQAHIEAQIRWARGGPKPVITRPIFPSLSFAAWDVAKSGSLTRMPIKERLAYTRLYNQFVALERVGELGIAAMNDFSGYRAFDRLSDAQAQQVLVILKRAASTVDFKLALSSELIAQAKAVGFQPAPVDAHMRANLHTYCREVGIEVPS
jgi:hypothetical protein